MTEDSSGSDAADEPGDVAVDIERFYEVVADRSRPVVTASDVASVLGCSQATAVAALTDLADAGRVERLVVDPDEAVWFAREYRDMVDTERVVVFPRQREIVVDQPSQFTRAQLSQFAHRRAANHDDGYVYEVREQDIWNTPYESVDRLLQAVRGVLGDRFEILEDWMTSQWERAHKFRLVTHDEGYIVLEAASPDLLGNIAEQKLDDGVLRARIDDTTAWVADNQTATVKRTLYEAGYPVQDTRDLETGAALTIELYPDLRPYQTDWITRFIDAKSGVLVGPPGSGKTIAALGIMAEIGGETLILVPSRDLARQWRENVLEHTSLTGEDVGEYHGGSKEIRPVTIATYQTAGMDRHRMLFDSRKWGLIVYDECQHIPSPISRRSAALQTTHRLGLSGSPIREDDKERDIYTLIGPPIGTDWEALFDAGYVAEPEVELRYVPWASDLHRNEYGASDGHTKRQLAASNPAKVQEIEAILAAHPGGKTIIFIEFIEQGDQIAEALNVPFISGRTPHARRTRLFNEFKTGDLDTLIVSRIGDEGIDIPNTEVAIAASGLGGSRRQGAQRAGRTMRPVGQARMYILATRGTREEDDARQRTTHLAARGVSVYETDPVAFEDNDAVTTPTARNTPSEHSADNPTPSGSGESDEADDRDDNEINDAGGEPGVDDTGE